MTKFQKIQLISSVVPIYSSCLVFLTTMFVMKKRHVRFLMWVQFFCVTFFPFLIAFLCNHFVMSGQYSLLNILLAGTILSFSNYMCVNLQIGCTNPEALPKIKAAETAIMSCVLLLYLVCAFVYLVLQIHPFQ